MRGGGEDFCLRPGAVCRGLPQGAEAGGSMLPLIIISHNFEKLEVLKKVLMQEYFGRGEQNEYSFIGQRF